MAPKRFPVTSPNHSPDTVGGFIGGRASPAAQPPVILSSKPTVATIWAAFRRRWRLAVSVGLVLGAVAGVAAWIATMASSFTATTTVRVQAQAPKVLPNSGSQTSFETYQRAQVAYIKSRWLLTLALHDPKVAELSIVRNEPDPLEWLDKQLQVDFSMSPEILRISLSGKEPEPLLTIVGAIREVYMREIANSEKTASEEHLVQVTKLYEEYVEQLKKKRAVLEDLSKNVGSGDPKFIAARQSTDQLLLSSVQTSLVQLQLKLSSMRPELASKLKRAKSAATATISDNLIEDAITNSKDRILEVNNKAIEEANETLDSFNKRSPNPSKEVGYAAAKTKLQMAQKAIADRRAELRPRMEAKIREDKALELQREYDLKKEEVDYLEELAGMYKKQIDDWGNSILDLGKTSNRLEGLRADIELAEAMVKKTGGEREVTRIELGAPDRISKMDDPYMVKRDGLGLKAAGGAALAGFLLGAVGIAFLEFRSRRVSSLSEVSRGLSLPIMGTLPLVRVRAPAKNGESGNASDASSQESMIESVDAARTVLLQAFRKKNLRVVMITSAGAGEGKTLLSAHLAISLARAGWRILLIDGDLRRPTQHKVFGLENADGLGEILRGDATLGDVVRQATGELTLISAGHGDQRSLRGLAQGELGRLFEEAKKDYDFVILDSAPVLPVADAQLMAQAVDGVILSVLQNVSRLPFVYEAYERLMLLHANLLGVVLHGESFGAYGSHYSYTSLEAGKTAPEKANG